MGIQDRDYYRDDSHRRWIGEGVSVTTVLVAVHIVLFLMLAFAPKPATNDLGRWLGYRTDAVLHGEVWRLVTAHLLPRQSLPTIIVGMYILYTFGLVVEAYLGPRLFLGFYLLSALVAGIAKLLLSLLGLIPPLAEDFGLAPTLFAVLTLSACFQPRHLIHVFFVLPVQTLHLVLFLIGLYLLAALLSAANGNFSDAPALLASSGFAFAFWFVRSRGTFGYGRPRLRIHRAPEPERRMPEMAAERPRGSHLDEHLEAKLDEVLEKMARHGRDTLTDDERAVLTKASEVYQRRKK